jgi:hypothetical protein
LNAQERWAPFDGGNDPVRRELERPQLKKGNMKRKMNLQELLETLDAVQFKLTDGRQLRVKSAWPHPQTGDPVVEMLDVEDHLRTAPVAAIGPSAGSSHIRHDWTLQGVRSLIHFLEPNAPPELVDEYLSTRDEAYFVGKTQAIIDAELIRFLEARRKKDPAGGHVPGRRPHRGVRHRSEQPVQP